VAVTAFLGALTSAVVLADGATLDAFRFWAVGALAGRDAAVAGQVAPFLAVGLLLALANAPALNLLVLGEDVARGLGQSLAVARWTGLVAITLLTGAAVAACGPVGFVGLVVPHVARHVTGPDHRWLLPAAGLAGAVLLLVADVVGRVVVRPGELQVGIVLGLLGAPFFVALVRRRRLASL
jgi:iron complex transport system permease protein